MSFVNRSRELAALARWWERGGKRPALVWGRRRVGKTALLQHFAEGLRAPVVFHTGAGDLAGVELADLARQVTAAAPGAPGDLRDLAVSPYVNWRDALDHLAGLARARPVLLVLDEFPELVRASPALPGVLRSFLDHVSGRTKLRIVMSGSSERTIQAMRAYRAPLYGRFDVTLLLHPFGPHEAAAMLPGLAPADRALAYGVAGGIPLYLAWWDQEAPLEQNLRALACHPGAPLFNEGKLVMATEADAGEHTAAVLSAIAAGATRHNEIRAAVGADPTRTLDRLTELRLVERQVPVTDDPARTRRRVYRISDEFLAFYLGPLMRYRAEIERGLGDSVVRPLLRRLDNHMGPVYEEAFRQHLRREANSGRLGSDVVAVGRWWRGDGQDEIDAVVLAEPDLARVPVLVGEAKWSRTADAARARARLLLKAASLTGHPEELRFAVCARDEVSHAGDDVLAVTAADIFSPDQPTTA